MTLLAISFHATRMNVVRSRWQSTTIGYSVQDMLAPQHRIGGYTGGTLVVFNWEKNRVIWQIDIDGASGFCWHDGLLYINMLRLAEIVAVNGHGREQCRLSHRNLNDLHTIVPTKRGFLLSSSGTDAIFEIDQHSDIIYEWYAIDHGYPQTMDGQRRVLDRSLDQRFVFYLTSSHTTHVNSARFYHPDQKVILATLFFQGTIIAIDCQSGQVQTLISGLCRPHDLRPHPNGGWIVSDAGNNQALILNEHWQITRRIAMDFDWVQSSAPLADGSIIIADTNHHRLVRVYSDDQRGSEERFFPPEWRVYLVEEVPIEYAHFFEHPIALPPL
jgi:hypothetical protein